MSRENIDIIEHPELFLSQRHRLEKCTKPIHEALGIPNEYYTSMEYFKIEGEIVLDVQ